MLAGAALVCSAAQGTPPFTPRDAPYLVNSAEQSPGSRVVLARHREKGVEGLFRTPAQSGELQHGIGKVKRTQRECNRRRHNLATAETVDPTVVPHPSPLTIAGAIGRPTQDRVFQPPANVTRAAALTSGCTLTALPDGPNGTHAPLGVLTLARS